jgi:hypothetical protein
MPKISGKDLISEATEKIVRRLVVISAVAILVKAYQVPLQDLKVLGVDLPSGLFDVVALSLIVYFTYALIISWVGDLAAFRLWYRESSIWSEFGTNMKLDKTFIRGGIDLLLKVHALEKGQQWPSDFSTADEKTKSEFLDFKTNVELYALRLEHAGTKFSLISAFGHYYVWVQSFLIPICCAGAAIYLLLKYGELKPPARF